MKANFLKQHQLVQIHSLQREVVTLAIIEMAII